MNVRPGSQTWPTPRRRGLGGAGEVAIQTSGASGLRRNTTSRESSVETRLYQVAPVSTNMILSYVAERVLGLPRSILMRRWRGTVVALEKGLRRLAEYHLAAPGASVKASGGVGDFCHAYDRLVKGMRGHSSGEPLRNRHDESQKEPEADGPVAAALSRGCLRPDSCPRCAAACRSVRDRLRHSYPACRLQYLRLRRSGPYGTVRLRLLIQTRQAGVGQQCTEEEPCKDRHFRRRISRPDVCVFGMLTARLCRQCTGKGGRRRRVEASRHGEGDGVSGVLLVGGKAPANGRIAKHAVMRPMDRSEAGQGKNGSCFSGCPERT